MAEPITSTEIDTMRSLPPDRLAQAVRDGDLLFASGRHWMSRAIRVTSWSPWSHVAILQREPGSGRMLVLESVEDEGVRAFALVDYLTRYEDGCPYDGRLVLARIDLAGAPHDAAAVAIAHARTLIGRDYDHLEVGRIALRLVGRALGRLALRVIRPIVPPRPWPDRVPSRAHPPRDGTYMCSELVWESFCRAGVTLGHDPDGFTSPAAIWRDDRVRCIGRID